MALLQRLRAGWLLSDTVGHQLSQHWLPLGQNCLACSQACERIRLPSLGSGMALFDSSLALQRGTCQDRWSCGDGTAGALVHVHAASPPHSHAPAAMGSGLCFCWEWLSLSWGWLKGLQIADMSVVSLLVPCSFSHFSGCQQAHEDVISESVPLG